MYRHRRSIGVLAVLVLTTPLALAQPLRAQESIPESDLPLMRALPAPIGHAGSFSTVNSDCAGAACDTVWVGHSSSGPGGAFLGVGVGGTWDFDTDVAGTDSTQGWVAWELNYSSGAQLPALQRPWWAYDFGNAVNRGNTTLWAARDLAGRKYVKTGVAGVWHADNLSGVKLNLGNGGEPSALPIVGARSAWCGLRVSGDQAAVDALTGNFINGDLQEYRGGSNFTRPEFPGYCNQWDQMLYKDFASAGSGSISFRIRTDLSNFVDNSISPEITGWFNPDPSTIAHFVGNPADSFMVYVGSPNEAAYDTNRRWFSEVVNVANPLQELFAVSGRFPFVQPDTALTRAYAGITPVGGKVRVVFRVKTNRARADQSTNTVGGFNSKDGAAVLDAVQVDSGALYGFDDVGDITARALAGDISLYGTPWVTTGRPPAASFHVENISALLYEDLCGSVGGPTRQCNLQGNVLVAGNKDNANLLVIEEYQVIESPTIDLAVRTAAPGTKNAQGIDKETAARQVVVLDYEIYSGFMSLSESIFWQVGGRFHGPAMTSPVSGVRQWSGYQIYPGIIFQPDPLCIRDAFSISSIGLPAGQMDSLRVALITISQGWRFGGTNLGNTRGTYFDNVRAGFVRGGEAPPLAQEIWNKYQDQFPFNEGVVPGDNAGFDTTTALVKTGLNIVAPATAPGVVAGDSILASAVYDGDGITTGVRLDLIFRIDPAPGNYSTKGNRTSALVNVDPAHPFFAAYLANNGPFGTPGGHGAVWNRHVWNSARMDSAEMNIHPIVSRGIGGPASPAWMGTLHELDPNFAALGITRNVCFLIDPNGAAESSNMECDGVPPAAYGSVAGTTKEGTKLLPDGWFSPGTHVEYFLRRSSIEDPGTATLLFDTTRVFPQDLGGMADYDQERWSNFDVLPDMWKSTRYGGAGLPCVLLIDANDRRGADPQYRGAADTMGYGKNNGASSGWKGLGPRSDPNNPLGFVSANLGTYGLNFEHYDVRASESSEAGRPGTRFAQNLGAISLKGDKSGPSPAMLATLYNNVLHLTGDLDSGTLHDGFDSQESADDIALFEGFLAGSTPANRRGVWLSGDGIMEDGALNSDDGTHLFTFLTDTFGSDLTSDSYKVSSLSQDMTVGFLPTAPWSHPGRIYGFAHLCTVNADVLQVVPTVDGASEAAQYQNLGPGPYTSSVYRPVNVNAGRHFRTLIDGFDLSNLRANYANLGQIPTLPGTDIGRLAWLDDVWTGHFQICARRGPAPAGGDLPGWDGTRFANAILGSYPNPAFAGRNVTLRFTLAEKREVTVRIYNVAGREVARLDAKGEPGPNTVVWDGTLSTGAHASAGVYFYSVDGIASGGDAGRASKLILLSNR